MPFDLGVVVERLLVLQRRVAQRRHAEHLQFVERCEAGRLPARIEEALPRVDVVLCNQFALDALEHRVVLEVDAGLDAHGPGPKVGRDFRHAVGRAGPDLERPRQMVVVVEVVEDVRSDDARVQVDELHRVHAGFGDDECIAQYLGRWRLRVRQRRQAQGSCGDRLERRASGRESSGRLVSCDCSCLHAQRRCRRTARRRCE